MSNTGWQREARKGSQVCAVGRAMSGPATVPNGLHTSSDSGESIAVRTPIKKDGELTIFFKVRNRTRKSYFPKNGTLDLLKEQFLKKYQWESENEFGFTKATLPPFWIEHPLHRTKFELEDINDLYDNSIIEVITSRAQAPSSTQTKSLEKESPLLNLGHTNSKLVIVMVGLPARGKTHIARKVARYLTWIGVSCRVFNVGQYRRARIGAQLPHQFFDPNNEEAKKKRLHMAIAALDDMIEWIVGGGCVGIYDGTNTTKARRKLVLSRCAQEHIEVMFLESIVEDQDIVEQNIRTTKLTSPDYADLDPELAVDDFRARIQHYQSVYETMDDDNLAYVKVIDIGRKIILNRISNALPSKIVLFLMNLHNTHRRIFLTRHGQSEFNESGRIGGDSNLTKLGDDYAHILAEWTLANLPVDTGSVTIYTSSMRRTIQTTQYIPCRKIRLKLLDEINAGDFDGFTYQQIAEQFPEEYAARAADKLRYRYPRGESYLDLIQRVEPIMFELERQKQDVIIVAHQAVLRCLYAYFTDLPLEDCPFVQIPLHTVIQLTPKTYFCEQEKFKLITDKAYDFVE